MIVGLSPFLFISSQAQHATQQITPSIGPDVGHIGTENFNMP